MNDSFLNVVFGLGDPKSGGSRGGPGGIWGVGGRAQPLNLGVPSHGSHGTLQGNYKARLGGFFHCTPLIGWGWVWVWVGFELEWAKDVMMPRCADS